MKPRSVEQWERVIADLPSPFTETAEQTIANRIISDLAGYRSNSKTRAADVNDIANALRAYARIVQLHGVIA